MPGAVPANFFSIAVMSCTGFWIVSPFASPPDYTSKQGLFRHNAVTGCQNARKPQITLDKRLTALLLMVPKARIELARPKATAPSRQRVYQFHHFGTQFYILFAYS